MIIKDQFFLQCRDIFSRFLKHNWEVFNKKHILDEMNTNFQFSNDGETLYKTHICLFECKITQNIMFKVLPFFFFIFQLFCLFYIFCYCSIQCWPEMHVEFVWHFKQAGMGHQATRHTELSLFRLQIEMAKWNFWRYKNAKLRCAFSWYAGASVLTIFGMRRGGGLLCFDIAE